MDKILESLENLFFKIVVLVFLIPKTLWKSITDKTFTLKTVCSELDKEDSFQDYASPVQVYLFTIIVPLYFILTAGIDHSNEPCYYPVLQDLKQDGFLAVFATLAVYSCYWPMQQTFISIIIERKSSKRDIQLFFYTYLYNFSLSLLGAILFLVIWVLLRVYTRVNTSSGLFISACVFLALWIFTIIRGFVSNLYAIQTFHNKFKNRQRKILWLMICQYLIILIVYIVLLLYGFLGCTLFKLYESIF